MSYNELISKNASIKMWTNGVPVDPKAIDQLSNVASLPFVYGHLAVMPDVHFGIGATVGSVIPTKGAIIPAAVGVDIGCGMLAFRISLTANHLPDTLSAIRSEIEAMVPVGFDFHGDKTNNSTKCLLNEQYENLENGFLSITKKHPDIKSKLNASEEKTVHQLGTLGGGNHFIELCLDENNDVWVMLHSGSRGVGNAIGRYFIEKAKEDMRKHSVNLPDKDLAYLKEGTEWYDDYIFAVEWAQNYAKANRNVMMDLVLRAISKHLPPFIVTQEAINCHHNYVTKEQYGGVDIYVTRKGAIRAGLGELGIIPGSMGAKSFIVRGKGNTESFNSCSHGAGRIMSRGEAKREITLEAHQKATAGVECRKDVGVLDESPAAYKDIDKVMAAQQDLVDVVHTLKQVLCVKG